MAFFEKIGKRLSDAGQNVAQQTQNLADVTRLNNAISEKEKRISQLFLAIGKSYYEGHKDDPAAEDMEKIAEVNALYAEIFENREKVKQIKGVVKCKVCGADVPLNASFCNGCGTKVNREETDKVDAEAGNVCPACHEVIENGNLFCNHCGARINNTHE